MKKEEAFKRWYGQEHDAASVALFEMFSIGWEAAIQSLQPPKDNIPYDTIIRMLNRVTGRNFKPVAATKKKIKARWEEGYREADFEIVVITKNKQWHLDKVMKAYLRPETLFGSKFEGYRNEDTTIGCTLEEWQ